MGPTAILSPPQPTTEGSPGICGDFTGREPYRNFRARHSPTGPTKNSERLAGCGVFGQLGVAWVLSVPGSPPSLFLPLTPADSHPHSCVKDSGHSVGAREKERMTRYVAGHATTAISLHRWLHDLPVKTKTLCQGDGISPKKQEGKSDESSALAGGQTPFRAEKCPRPGLAHRRLRTGCNAGTKSPGASTGSVVVCQDGLRELGLYWGT